MEELQKWYFKYNPYTQQWGASNNARSLTNEWLNKNAVIRSNNIGTLISMIVKYKGDIVLINQNW